MNLPKMAFLPQQFVVRLTAAAQGDEMIAPQSPTIIRAEAALSGASALAELLALDSGRNRQCMLNLGGQALGGHLAAHGIMAAARSAPDMEPASLSLLFVSGADPTQHYTAEVEALRNGGSFSHRRVRLAQPGATAAEGLVLLRKPSATDIAAHIHHIPAMPDVPSPEELHARETRTGENHALTLALSTCYPFLEIRGPRHYLPGTNLIEGKRAYYWLRIAGSAALDLAAHYGLLTLASDFWYTLPLHSLQDEGRPTFFCTSLDHVIWFHSRPDMSEWILVETEGLLANDNIGLMRANYWSRCGRPIATVMQQALIREPPA